MRKVELALLWENHVWDTEIVEVPEDLEEHTEIIEWFQMNLMTTAKYENMAMVAMYNDNPEEGEEDEDEKEITDGEGTDGG